MRCFVIISSSLSGMAMLCVKITSINLLVIFWTQLLLLLIYIYYIALGQLVAIGVPSSSFPLQAIQAKYSQHGIRHYASVPSSV
jgi:hypothetical protein